MIRRSLALAAALCATPLAAAAQEATPTYAALFDARLVPTERAARVTVRIDDPQDHLRTIEWQVDPERHRDFEGDGVVEVEGDVVRWQPPKGTSRLRYTFRIDHLRDERSYDARSAEGWAIFRGDDLVPPARVRTAERSEPAWDSVRFMVPAHSPATIFSR